MSKNFSILTEKNRKIFERMSVDELSKLVSELKKQVKELENYNRFRMKFSDEKTEKKVVKQTEKASEIDINVENFSGMNDMFSGQ